MCIVHVFFLLGTSFSTELWKEWWSSEYNEMGVSDVRFFRPGKVQCASVETPRTKVRHIGTLHLGDGAAGCRLRTQRAVI